MSLLERLVSLISLDILVLHGVDGCYPQLHLGEVVQSLVLGHLPVLALDLVECIARKS